jgi:hypothetical protein
MLCFQTAFSQIVEITGKVTASSDVENIHVINKTAQVFTTTNASGSFKISAKLNDTLQFTSIQHKLKEVVVDPSIFIEKQLNVHLEELTYQLDEVVVGRILTGDLLIDLSNVEGEPVTAKQLGIPSYQGKLKTQSERRLHDAGEFKPVHLLGLLGGSLNLHPIINAISGRTKLLKSHVDIEQKDNLLYDVRKRTEVILFTDEILPDHLRTDYFYFCSEDPDFITRCNDKSDIEILEFLNERLIVYKAKLKQEHEKN